MKKKKHKKVMKVILLIISIILIIISSLLIYYFINVNSINKNSKKMEETIKEIKDSNISYIFLDINPSFTLVMKNETISQVVCRNDDCIKLKKHLNIEGKTLDIAIDEIYNSAKEQGYNTKDGIYIKSSTTLSQTISANNYVHIEKIELNEEKQLLKENKDTIEIELSDNEKLIEKLKKDEDYGNIYSCSIINEKVECHFNENMKTNDETNLMFLKRIASVLNRFGIKTESGWEMGVAEEPLFKLYIDGIRFINLSGVNINQMDYIGTQHCNTVRFRLGDLNLLNPADIQEHYYVDEHDIVIEPETNKKHSIYKLCYKGKCKEHFSISNYYCNYETNAFEGDAVMHYVIYNEDGSNYKELTEEKFNDYEVMIDTYISSLPECEIVDTWYDQQTGAPHPSYKSPYGEYCKYKDENNQWEYATAPNE